MQDIVQQRSYIIMVFEFMSLGDVRPVRFLALNIVGVTGASEYDGKVFDTIRPVLHNNELYGDKAYQRPDTKEVQHDQNLTD